MKILVDEMPKTHEECPYCEDMGDLCGDKKWWHCRYSTIQKYHQYSVARCEDVSDCPYFRAIGDTNLAEKVSDLEWSHRNHSEEE